MKTRGQGGTLVDVAVLASTFNLEEPKLHAVLDAPTADLVKELLATLTIKAEEFNTVKAEKLRSTVELENTIRTNEAKTKALRSTVTKSQREVEELRNTVTSLENSRAELRSEIDRLKSSSTTSSTEADTLHNRISSLEAANREALSLVESKSVSHDKLNDELAAQHQKIVALRRDISGLEDTKQSLENAASAARFREQNLDQEVSLLKKNIRWHESELKTRGDEFAKFRKEKNARIASLQRQNEDNTATIESLRRTESTLRTHIDEISLKAEDALGRIQSLQEQAAAAESAFQVELESARRLADLQKQSADTARSRLQELTSSLDHIKDAAADEIGQLQAEIETERTDKAQLESRLIECEDEIERLRALPTFARPQTPVPGTPARSTNGLAPATPLRAGSPAAFTPGTGRSKLGANFTQLYSENNALKSDLEDERRRNAKLTSELEEIIQDLENRGPEQEDFRQDKERMESEVMEMSQLLESSLSEKESALAKARKAESTLSDSRKESQVLRQQLRDLSAQIKILLVEMQARDQGLEALDPAGQAQLQMLAAGDVDQDTLGDQTSAGALITQRLLLFRSVNELQEQNTQLLKLNRGLAERMEGEEARIKEAQQTDRIREIDELRERLRRHEDDLRSSTTQIQSITRERDMFRRMLSGRGGSVNGEDESVLGQSIIHNGLPATPRTGRHQTETIDVPPTPSRLPELVKELQAHADAIRQESSTNQGILRQQVDQLAKEKSTLQSELARSTGNVTLAQERYEMLQSNYRMLQGENGELQKRNQSLHETSAKQDLRTQQVAEELVDVKTLAESMRADAANLRAEKELWKKVEARINEDNHALTEERSRLNKMITDLQSLQNEREQADTETRRRLQARIENVENELSGVRNKLEAETEESKKAHLRREYEQSQSQTRIDDLVKSLSAVREDLVAAKTTCDQLQARVDEMKVDLRNAEERNQALQPRPSSGGPLASAEENSTNNLSHEQELALELADMKRDLELAKTELDNGRTQVEQFKTLALSSEEELQSLNDTYDQYREDTDRQLAEKEAAIQQLEQRIGDLNNELSTTNTELSNIRTQHEQSGMQLEEQKTALESEVARLKDECERQTEKARLHQQDLKAQAEIAQQAQQSYEDELVKHADAAKSLQSLRAEYNALRSEVASIRAEAEAARISLAQGQEAWSDMKLQYEKELSDARNSREDLKAQNRLVHDQLESVSKQISSLHDHRSKEPADNQDGSLEQSAGSKLQEIVSYLRREKEIVDVQCELAVQESKRTRQQLDYTRAQLEETREKLSEERRNRTSQETNAVNHNKLVETINELNLYRESSATLRQEARQAQSKLQEVIKEVEDLTSQIQPLQGKIREVESELELKEGELKLLQEDRDRWRERTQNIISKYDRVDPAEIEGMKSKITELERERDELKQSAQTLQLEIDSIPEKIQEAKAGLEKTSQEQKAKLIEQAKSRNNENRAQIRDLQAQVLTVQGEKTVLESSIAKIQSRLDVIIPERDAAVAERDRLQQTTKVTPPTSNEEASAADEGPEEGEINDTVPDGAATTDSAAQAQVQEQAARAESLQNEVLTLGSTIEAQNRQIGELEQQVADLSGQVEILQTSQGASLDVTATPDASDQVNTLRTELAATQEELKKVQLQQAAANSTTIPALADGQPPADTAGNVAAQVAQLKEQLEQQHQLSQTQLQAEYERRTANMKTALNQKLKEGREKARAEVREEVRQELINEHSQELETLRKQHAEALELLKEQHRQIVERVTKEGAAAVERAKATDSANPADAKPESPAAQTSNIGTPATESDVLTITDAQAKTLLQKNDFIRGIFKNNLTKKIAEELKKAKDEQERLLAEKEKVINDREETVKTEKEEAVKKAVNMEAMKQKIKLNMAETQSRTAKAKLDIVETAARDTPQRAVIEVWDIARIVKAPPVVAGGAVAASTPAKPPGPKAAAAQPAVAVPSTPAASAAAAVQQPAQPSATTSTPDEEQSRLAARQARFGAPAAAAESAPNGNAATEAKSEPTPSSTPAATSAQAQPATRGGLGIPRGASGIPGRGRGGLPRPAQAPGSGPAPAQLGRGGGVSGLPRGGLGGSVPRGGFARRGGAATAAAAASAANLNAGAKQFVPGGPGAQAGAKRPLEGAEQGQGDEKRVRGAGTTS